MRIEVKIEEELEEPVIIIKTKEMTQEVQGWVRALFSIKDEKQRGWIAGYREELVELLSPEDIYRIYTVDGKIFAETRDQEYRLRLRFYEMEEILDEKYFVRISSSEIINLRKVKNFDLSFTGTICVKLLNQRTTYVSRRYIAKIKQKIGL